MPLPAPDLDDRRFQDLVDDAKRLVQQRCPEWTDHNVSDPGVTLIETFAYMVDQLLYRLNRVPDRTYVKFLDLLGVTLFPPSAARVDVTFWLSAPQPAPLHVDEGAQVATADAEPLLFTVTEALEIVPCRLERLATGPAEAAVRDRGRTAEEVAGGFLCFSEQPVPGDTFLVGLDAAVPRCAVLLRLDCEIEGVGVDPRDPPLAWEAWTGSGWASCEVDRDSTGGLNRGGDVVVHVPRGHVASLVAGQRAAWLRCRVLPPREGQPAYTSSPRVRGLAAMTVGGTAAAVHAEVVTDEVVGLSEGVPGQRFSLARRPVVADDRPLVVEVAAGEGWGTWTQVEDLADSGPQDPHAMLDATAGELVFGPAVRERDGSLRSYGAVPPAAAPIRVPRYLSGGGKVGNVGPGALTVLKTSIPYVDRVENRRRAVGGVDGESVEQAKVRGPLSLRTRNRAVTVADHELLAAQAAPEAARVRCVPAGQDGIEAGGLRVLVVPDVGGDGVGVDGRLRFADLVPSDATLARIAAALDERRLVGARIVVEPPTYQGLTVVARLRARERSSQGALKAGAIAALDAYFSPLVGGPDATGWPFGRPVHVGEVYAVLQRLDGTEFVEEARLYPADPITGERGESVSRLELAPNALVFSYSHQVLVG